MSEAPLVDGDPARGDDAYPSGGRLVAGTLALLLVSLALLNGAAFVGEGKYVTAAAWALSALPPALLLGGFAAAPERAQHLLGRVSRLDLHDSGHVFAFVLLTLAAFLIFGLGSIVSGALGLENRLAGEPVAAPVEGDEATRLGAVLFQNLFLLVAPAVVWVVFVNDVPLQRAAQALGLRRENAAPATLQGVAAAFAVLLGIFVLGTLAQLAGMVPEENEVALAIGQSLSIGGAVALAAISSTTEEVFFRGLLTPRWGVIGSSLLFSVAHLSYVNVLQVVVTFALGVVFAVLYQRTRNLWAPIATHFTFNLIMLLAARYAPPT